MKFRHGGLSGRLMPRGKLKENEALPHHRLGHRARRRCNCRHAGERQPDAGGAQGGGPPPLATTDVLVAKTDLNTGQVVSEGGVGWEIWPAAAASSALVRKSDRPGAIKEFVGALVRSPIAAGEPIRDFKVVLAKGGGFMAAVLPHGMRAIALDNRRTTMPAAPSCRTTMSTWPSRAATSGRRKLPASRNTSAKQSYGTCGCSRSTSRLKKRTAKKSRSARPPPSSLIRSKPKRWRWRVSRHALLDLAQPARFPVADSGRRRPTARTTIADTVRFGVSAQSATQWSHGGTSRCAARRWLRNTAPALRRQRNIRMPMSPKSVNSADDAAL